MSRVGWVTALRAARDVSARAAGGAARRCPVGPSLRRQAATARAPARGAGRPRLSLGVTPSTLGHPQLDVPKVSNRNCHGYITASAGAFAKEGEAANDAVSSCPSGGAKRATSYTSAAFTTKLRLACEREPRPGPGPVRRGAGGASLQHHRRAAAPACLPARPPAGQPRAAWPRGVPLLAARRVRGSLQLPAPGTAALADLNPR